MTLNVTDLRKSFNDGEVIAVNDVSFYVEQGEFVVFVGPSGCGKTTILRSLAGLEIPDSGTIELNERNITKLPPRDRNIAMVFQNFALYPSMTVYENMSFGLRMNDVDRKTIDENVNWAADTMEISELLHRYPNQLSGGQQQRVALGRSIVRDPDLFLLDEPLTNLDAKLRNKMRTEIQQLQQELDATMIFVTHDQKEAMTMGDKIVVMNEGRVEQFGTPEEVYHYPNSLFVASFIGDLGINFLVAETGPDSITFGDHSKELPGELSDRINANIDGDRVALGIRPENIEITHGGAGIEVETKVVEPVGHSVIVYFTLSGQDFKARMTTETGIREGDTVNANIDWSNVLFFSPKGPAIGKWKDLTEQEPVSEVN